VFDLTALSPGGQTGGSGLVATSLVRELRQLAPEWELLLLTSADSHAQLAPLDAPNVRRVCVASAPSLGDPSARARPTPSLRCAYASRAAEAVLTRMLRALPPETRVRARNGLWRLLHERPNGQMLERLRADLVVSPFTAITYWHPRIPQVTIVHDLQHLAYPQFFSDEQRLNRDAQIRLTRKRATTVVCVSEFVRQSLVAYLPTLASRTRAIPHGLLHDWSTPQSQAGPPFLNLPTGAYLLYPANFWPHKNHRVLFEAFRRFRDSTPTSNLKLVCTGAPNAAMADLHALAEQQLGPDTVIFLGHVPEAAFQALLDNCAALIYPSVYEGFGMPILEAMARGKPVLCSRIAPLEEVAGEAAEYFDPTNPEEIAQCITFLTQDAEASHARVALGQDRARTFGTGTDMARKYMALSEELLGRAAGAICS
jgi:glycosyltransferase involved in cell wall biosynthesis